MTEKSNKFLYKNKPKIGLFHGISACIGAVLLSFLTSMQLTHLITGDYALKIVPALILTPILMTLYGTWLLFSNTNIQVLKKISIISLILFCSLIISIEVF